PGFHRFAIRRTPCGERSRPAKCVGARTASSPSLRDMRVRVSPFWHGKFFAGATFYLPLSVLVKDLDISLHQISDGSRRLLDCAVDEARRRGHTQLLAAHLLLGFIQTEAPLFQDLMADTGAPGRA